MNLSELKPKEILEYHYQTVGKPFQVQLLKGKVVKKRVWYPSGKFDDGTDGKDYIEVSNQRSVLPNEIVIDLDGNTIYENGELLREVKYRLNIRGYTYDVWHTGSKGLHCHLYFPELLEMEERQRSYIRAKMLAIFKDLKADQQMKSEKVMVLMENCQHRKTLQLKTFLEHVEGHRHAIPRAWIKEALRTPKTYRKGTINFTKGKLPPHIEKVLKGTLTDARKRVAFVLAAYLRDAYQDKRKVLEILEEWASRQTKHIPRMTLISTVNSVFNKPDARPSKAFLDEILYGVEII